MASADAARGVTTAIYCVDALPAPLPSVTVDADEGQNKAAIDALCGKLNPDYVVLLGATDVIPHQTLNNPCVDDDSTVPSDLPYACEARYSADPSTFLAPTRVVSRLPDVTGATDCNDLLFVIYFATIAAASPAKQYLSNLSATADVWQLSSDLSAAAIFGAGQTALPVPPNGPTWPQIGSAYSHFFNCHGAPGDACFYGQNADTYPVALDANWVDGRLAVGVILAAECCYGAQLYNPSALNIHKPMCNTYLSSGCYGYFGSSTIAYGPATSNGQADLICQYFLEECLAGQSIGTAGLRARARFIGEPGPRALRFKDPCPISCAWRCFPLSGVCGYRPWY